MNIYDFSRKFNSILFLKKSLIMKLQKKGNDSLSSKKKSNNSFFSKPKETGSLFFKPLYNKKDSVLSKDTIQLQEEDQFNQPRNILPERKRELVELARNPINFINTWQGLNISERLIIVQSMKSYYGTYFANEFNRLADSGQLVESYFSTSHRNTASLGILTPDRLTALGFRLARIADRTHTSRTEIWRHPSGREISISPEREEINENDENVIVQDTPQTIEIPINPESTYGDRLSVVEGSDAETVFPGFLSISLYQDGTIEGFTEDGDRITYIVQSRTSVSYTHLTLPTILLV